MTTRTATLDNIAVAAPCPASWDDMQGDDKVRFCAQCKLNVFNLSAMSRDEAEEMVQSREGRLCVRFFQRADGTVLTANCPVGLAALRRELRHQVGRCAAVLGLAFAGLVACVRKGGTSEDPPAPPPATQTQVPDATPLMGEVMCPTEMLGKMVAPVAADAGQTEDEGKQR